MAGSDKNIGGTFYERSIPLIRRCLNEKISITVLLSTLQMIDKGYISGKEELESYMARRAELNPTRSSDVEKIRDILLIHYF